MRRGRDGETERLRAQVAKLERTLEKVQRGQWKSEEPQFVDLVYDAAPIRIDGSTKLSRKRRNAVAKERHTVSWIESLPAGAVFYDIGANVGAYSLIGALRPQGPLWVVAFEPGYANFATLCTNVFANAVGDRVVPLPVALGSRSEVGSFGYSDLRAGAALHHGIRADGASHEQRMLVYALDDLVSWFDLPHPEHIKLDVDGAELEVLAGARHVLADPRLTSLLAEIEDGQREKIATLLSAHGLYEATVLSEEKGPIGGERSRDVLYRRRV